MKGVCQRTKRYETWEWPGMVIPGTQFLSQFMSYLGTLDSSWLIWQVRWKEVTGGLVLQSHFVGVEGWSVVTAFFRGSDWQTNRKNSHHREAKTVSSQVNPSKAQGPTTWYHGRNTTAPYSSERQLDAMEILCTGKSCFSKTLFLVSRNCKYSWSTVQH